MSLSTFSPHAATKSNNQGQPRNKTTQQQSPFGANNNNNNNDHDGEASSWHSSLFTNSPISVSTSSRRNVEEVPPFRLERTQDEDDEKQKFAHLYVLPVLLLEFLAIALTRAVLPSILIEHYGDSVYLVLGCADCVKGILAFLACPIFGKISDIVGRRICLFVTVLGSCAPVCSLALFSWGDPIQFSNLFSIQYANGTSSIMDPSASAAINSNNIIDNNNGEDAIPSVVLQGDGEMTTMGGHPISASSITVFIVLLAMSGIFSSTFTLVFAYISDTVRQRDERVAAYGLALATFGLSFTIGPMAGGYLAQDNTHLVFLCSLVLTILDALYIYFILPESKKDVVSIGWKNSAATVMSIHEYPGSWSPMETIRLVAFDPFLRRVGQVAFLYYTGLWAIISTLSLYAVQRFHLTPERLGELMSALGLSTMVAEAVLVRIMVPILGEKKSCRIGLFSFACQCVVLGFAYEGWHLFVCVAFSMLGNLVYPSLSSLVSGNVEPEGVGEALGALNGIKALTEGIGPLLFGSLMTISEKSSSSILPGWPYLLASLLVFGAYHMANELPDDEEYIHELDVKFWKQREQQDGMNIQMQSLSNDDDDEYVRLLSEIDTSDDEADDGIILQHQRPYSDDANVSSSSARITIGQGFLRP